MKEQKCVWIYCRIDAPEDAHGSLKNQKKELYDYADQMGFAVVGSSEDIGSGLDMNRPGLLEVMKSAEEWKMEVLLVKRLDRLGRDAQRIFELISILEKRSIAIYSPLEGEIALELYKHLLDFTMEIKWEVPS